MPEFKSKWISSSNMSREGTSKTSETTFRGFGGSATRAFLPELEPTSDQGALYQALKSAIQELSSICPDDLWERMDLKLAERARLLGTNQLNSPELIRTWANDWRQIFEQIKFRTGGVA